MPTGEHNLLCWGFLGVCVRTTFQVDLFSVQLQGYAGADVSTAQGSRAGAGADGQVWRQDSSVNG